jgi:hypothetical protein
MTWKKTFIYINDVTVTVMGGHPGLKRSETIWNRMERCRTRWNVVERRVTGWSCDGRVFVKKTKDLLQPLPLQISNANVNGNGNDHCNGIV